MFLVGIDVAKDKHDCFICDSGGMCLKMSLPFPMIGRVSIFFYLLCQRLLKM